MHRIDGTSLAGQLRDQLKNTLKISGLTPCLAVLLVGDDPASTLYVKLKKKAAEEVGIKVELVHASATAPESELMSLIKQWNADPNVHGILIQLPLPAHFEEQRIIDAMAPKKDADGFHPDNLAKLYDGDAQIIPPVHEGILRLIGQTPLRINGAKTVILGNSEIFTKPLERLLTTAGANVTRLHADQVSDEAVKAADLVISAVGSAHLIQPRHVKDDVVIIDVGTTKLANDTIVGDVEYDTFEPTDCWITPVPGGVGPMTIAQLLWNVFTLAKRAAANH